MALPTTNLTLHFDASTNATVYNTFSSPGPPSGNCVDGDSVAYWDDQGDGIADIAVITGSAITHLKYRATTPLMKNPCLDYDGSATTNLKTNDGTAGVSASSVITNTAFTIAFVFYAESITKADASDWTNHQFIGDSGGWWGLMCKDNGGTPEVYGYNFPDRIAYPIAINKTWIAVYRHDSGNLKFTVIDDASVEHNATDVASGNTGGLNGVTIGGGSFAGDSYNGRIGEFAVYNAALTGSNLTDLKNYFIAKWLGSASADLPFSSQMSVRRIS